MQLDMLVNGKALAEYAGVLLRDYDVTDCPVENIYFKPKNHTSYTWMAGIVGLKNIRVEIAFWGHNRHEVMFNKSQFSGDIYGKCELFLPDGFWYTSMLTDVHGVEWIGDEGAIGTYEFMGQAHGAYEEFENGSGKTSVLCRSTVPLTDCIMTYTVPAGASATYNFNLNGSRCASFKDLEEGDICVLDGINKLLLKNGNNYASHVVLTKFPQLTRGENTKNASAVLGYYPTYM